MVQNKRPVTGYFTMFGCSFALLLLDPAIASAQMLKTMPVPPVKSPVALHRETTQRFVEDFEDIAVPLDLTADPVAADPVLMPAEVNRAIAAELPSPSDRPEVVSSTEKVLEAPADIEVPVEGAPNTPSDLLLSEADTGTAPPGPKRWRATLWGGVMTDNDLEESFTFQNLTFLESGLFGLGISRFLVGGNSIQLEGELQLFQHFGEQTHQEGTAALALRWVISPSFSVAFIEGFSYATDIPPIEDKNNTFESQFLNYMGFEAEYSFTSSWAIAGRIHHRSGAFGTFNGAYGGSNAYLFGVRHRF